MKNFPKTSDQLKMPAAVVIFLGLIRFASACKDRDDSENISRPEITEVTKPVAAEIDITREPAVVLSLAESSLPTPIFQPNCEPSFRCPPTVRPVHCVANEIAGKHHYEVESAANHCVGISRLWMKICNDSLKLSDFDTNCSPKSE